MASAAVVANALADAQGRPVADEADRPPEVPPAQQRSAAQALVDVCAERLAGGPGGNGDGGDDVGGDNGSSGDPTAGRHSGRRARPAYVVDVDLADLEATQAGRLRLRLPGAPPRVSARRVAADAARGADVRVVVSDGAAPHAVNGVAKTDGAARDHDHAIDLAEHLRVPKSQKPGMAALLAAVERAARSHRCAASRHHQPPDDDLPF